MGPLPAMSWAERRRSNPIEALIACMIASGPAAKRPPHMVFRLQADLGGPSFEVLTIATGRNAPEAMRRFFDETQVTHLPLYIDPRNALAAPMGVMGLPVTVLIDPEGREAARLIGEAEWDSPEARAILAAFMAGG
jgi:hypothetical protein